MENGHGWRIADKFLGLTTIPIRSSNNDHDDNDLFQVMKAVESAEATIKQQVEENIRLRSELEHMTLKLHRQKLQESTEPQNCRSLDPCALRSHHVDQAHQPAPNSAHQQVRVSNSEASTPPSADTGGMSSPSSRSRYNTEGEYNPPLVNSGEGLMELNNSRQDLRVKVKENEQEIMRLRRQLADYSIREEQIRNEKNFLEKRIAYMRLIFDQQQQDVSDAASKALSYRHEVIEENIHLAYTLQDVQQEKTTFVSSLLPVLADYSLRPQISDAQSIASNVKILFRHLQEKLIMTESKLKQFQYQVRPWQSNSNSDQSNNNIASQSTSYHSIGAALEMSSKDRLEMVTKSTYSDEKVPVSPPDAQTQTTAPNWDQLNGSRSGLSGVDTKNMEHTELVNRNSAAPAVPAKPTIARLDANRYRDETPPSKQVKFHEPERQTHADNDDHDAEGYSESGGSSPYNDRSSSYPRYLSPVHEDLFSEEDDPLPAIEGLQISGEAFPGHELQASGYSTNGTTSCNFEWVHHFPDGSVNYIEGAKQPNYLLTADDVDTYLAIEVQPLDNRKRKGELVKVFANEHKKITCDPEMQSQIQKILQKGHGSFKVLEFTGFLDIWEPATLAIKRGAYSIKRSSEPSVAAAEKFSPNTIVSIPFGSPSEFIITDSDIVGADADHLLKTNDDSCSRDTLVVILRLFILRAVERRTRKGKKRVLFF